MQDFDFVDPEWIKAKIKAFGLKNGDLAVALNVSGSQISQWIGGNRNPSSSTKAALFYYFSSLELTQLRNRSDVLKLSNMQYLPVRNPANGKQYIILWNHSDRKLVVNRSEIDDIKYIDLSRYKYLLLDPDFEHYSVLYEINISGELKLDKKAKAQLATDFEAVYAY